MSTAQTIRDAAVTWPMPHLNRLDNQIVQDHGYTIEQFYQTDTYRVFLLIVAASLDGGERLPMKWKDGYYINGRLRLHGDELNLLIRWVEQHHGIGVKV